MQKMCVCEIHRSNHFTEPSVENSIDGGASNRSEGMTGVFQFQFMICNFFVILLFFKGNVGTFLYLAPELCHDKESAATRQGYDQKVDIFRCGICADICEK